MMQRSIILTIISAIPFCAGPPGLRAQTACDLAWSAPVRVSADSSVPTLPSVSVSDGTVHLLWYGIDTTEDTRLAASGLLYARRAAGEGIFGPPRTLLPAARALPGYLASYGDHVFVTSAVILDTFFGTALFSSDDSGATWTGPVPILGNTYPELIFTLGSAIFIQFLELETGFRGMLRSTDAGTTWETVAYRIRELSDVARSGHELHAVGPTPGGSQTEVGYYVSGDSARQWFGPEIISPEDFVRSAVPRIAVIEKGYTFAAWIDTGTVFLRGSRNNGLSWGVWNLLSGSPGNVSLDITADTGYVFAVWGRDLPDSNGIRGRLSVDEGETFCPEMDPAGSPGAREPATSLTDSTLHLSWVDHSGAAPGVYYREGELRGGGGNVDIPPSEFALRQSYPNPTNGVALIPFDVPVGTGIELELYNVLGERVRVLAGGVFATGRYVVPVNVSELPSGVYFYRLTAAGFDSMKKMIVLR